METTNKIETSKELSGFIKSMKEMLFNVNVIAQISNILSDDIVAKFTEMEINGECLYAIWEHNIYFNKGWLLLKFGTLEDVKPEWDKYLIREQLKGIIQETY